MDLKLRPISKILRWPLRSSRFSAFKTMAPSASKQKRLAEKAAKKSAGINGNASTSTSTPAGSTYDSSAVNTPLTSLSAANSKANSTEDLLSMAKLNLATDRSVQLSTTAI